jgi:hypothetical protein
MGFLEALFLVLALGGQGKDALTPPPADFPPEKHQTVVPDDHSPKSDDLFKGLPKVPYVGSIIVGNGTKVIYKGQPVSDPETKTQREESVAKAPIAPGPFAVVNRYGGEPGLSSNVTFQSDLPTVRECLQTLQQATGLEFRASDTSYHNYVVANQLQVDSVPAFAFMNLLETSTNMKCKWRRQEGGFVLEIQEMTNNAQLVPADASGEEFPWVRNVLVCGILLLGASVLGVLVLRKRRQRTRAPSEVAGISGDRSNPESI